MTKKTLKRATSTELTGGAGFTYEDCVVAYYLAALLREESATPLAGVVTSVAVQQAGQNQPMDDIVVECEEAGARRSLSLQAKRDVTISAATSNDDFRDIMARAVALRKRDGFQSDLNSYGFVCEYAAVNPLRSLNRLIDWAKSSPFGQHFAGHFAEGGAAANAERVMRGELRAVIQPISDDEERNFYAQFVALKIDGLNDGGIVRTEIINRLQDLVSSDEDGQSLLLFDRLCRIARDGAATGQKWTRSSLLTQLRGAVRLKTVPNYRDDLKRLSDYSKAGLADIADDVSGIRIDRPALEESIRQRLTQSKIINISGLPGCGKSAILKRIASADAARGPILFLKSDRLEGSSWLTFAHKLGLKHSAIGDLLAEIGSTGTPILFIDGIDRVRPSHRPIITDILRAIEEDVHLANWTVLASSRDQGLEAYRAWLPASFYRGKVISDVSVDCFSAEEAEELAQKIPTLRRLLFASAAEIARRPFFAAVLAYSFPQGMVEPQTEVDLIEAWWQRAGHNALETQVPQRRRALLDLAEKGVRNLGKNVRGRDLSDATVAQLSDLTSDHLVRTQDGGASYSFAHDIFFEWVFFRYLIDLGDAWKEALLAAGEPPLLGRVVALLAQRATETPGQWSTGYAYLDDASLRPQWRREWLTAPPFTPGFPRVQDEFLGLLTRDDHALFGKLLVWFQAQHTIPSPLVLQNADLAKTGPESIGLAELLGWPSDFTGWGRLIDWLLPHVASLPAVLLPSLLEVFDVWQNVFCAIANPRSAAIIDACHALLLDFESVEYAEGFGAKEGRWSPLGSEARNRLASSLRTIILRSARSYPDPAIALYERAVQNKRMRSKAYEDLMVFTPAMVDVSPEVVARVAKAEILEELPQDLIDRKNREEQERIARIERIRAIPEAQRTEAQRRTVDHVYFPMGRDRCDLDRIGIDRHHSYYYPVSALHEPFATLFAKKPDVALRLVHDLANHATKGWRQIHLINRGQMGTPIPVTLEFPWGKQEFWGDWNVYNWFLGQLTAQPLECAFLALSHWAFEQIEAGQPTEMLIRSILEGSECYASLGLALTLALETYDVSETTLAIATCQRLWAHDTARWSQEPSRNIDLFGFGFLSRLTGDKAVAKEFLDSRKSRGRNIRELAMLFALSSDEALRNRFKEALARFPEDLPYEFEEERTSEQANASLKAEAERLAGLGDVANYRQQQRSDSQVLIAYEPPKPLTPNEQNRLDRSTSALQEYSVIAWVRESLEANALGGKIDLKSAIVFARARDTAGIFARRLDAGDHSAQTVVAAVAAVIIRLGEQGPDLEWAWEVMDRVGKMAEPLDMFAGSQIPWHPCNYLVVALLHDRAVGSPRGDSVRRLLDLTAHPLDGVAQFAFQALFRDPDERVRWNAAQLAIDLSIYHAAIINKDHTRDHSADQHARKQSLARAKARLDAPETTALPQIPPAWVKEKSRRSRPSTEEQWADPDPCFDPQFAAKLVGSFPVENWCGSAVFKDKWIAALKEFVAWTSARLTPPWLDEKDRRRSDRHTTDLIAWNDALGDLIARTAPFLETETVRKELLAPFLTQDEEGLEVLSVFAQRTVCRHVMDAATTPANTLALLGDCVERVVRDRTFARNNYRAGEVNGRELPALITALFFVNVDKECPGAARFANGDWSDIVAIMPLVTRLVCATGWSSFVMKEFLKLCERAGAAYPLDAFGRQMNDALDAPVHAKGSWAGTRHAARIAATVQRLADANFPLRVEQARALLKVLDALVDLGDRRSAALEQTEAFKGIQGDPI